MKFAKSTLFVLLGALVLMFKSGVVHAKDNLETTTIGSGNGTVGGVDSGITFLRGPSNEGFNHLIEAEDFESARSGQAASIIAPHKRWRATLPADPEAKWISSSAGGATQGATALYAQPFQVSTATMVTASLELYYLVDDRIGDNYGKGVYINGTPIDCNVKKGSSRSQTGLLCDNISSLLKDGENTLYIQVTNTKEASGIIYSANILVFVGNGEEEKEEVGIGGGGEESNTGDEKPSEEDKKEEVLAEDDTADLPEAGFSVGIAGIGAAVGAYLYKRFKLL